LIDIVAYAYKRKQDRHEMPDLYTRGFEMTKVDLAYVDFSGETSRVGVYMADFNAANLTGQGVAANLVRVAISNITLCNEANMTASLLLHTASGAAPTDPNAQRELGVEVFYTDSTNGRKGRFTIPGPDLTLLQLAKDEVVLADSGVMAALVTAIQTNLVSRDQNAITVTGARLEGRHN
jgi:hypothetical protein